jgi:diguanylate cyclase (GGDEF)-like protein
VCVSLKQTARAERLFTKSLQDATAIGDKPFQAECLLALGDLLLAQQQETLGFGYLTQSLALAEELGARATSHRAHRSLAAACKRAGELRSALEHFERYHQLDKEIFNEAAERHRQGLAAQLETQQAERKAEIFRLKNVELVKAFQQLQQLHHSLQEADQQKTTLLDKLSSQTKQLEAMAREDPLTGLLNRRSLALELAKEFATAWRFKKNLTVAIADLDYFKRINEQFGEDRGDMVLRAVSNMLCKGLRSIDTVGRQGGGQFAMVLAGSNVKNAARVCDRIRAEIEGYRWAKLAPGLEVTISIGMTDDLTLGDHEKMVTAAEAQLAKAKRQGKNQVCWQ